MASSSNTSTSLGLPLFLEDLTGLTAGPTEFTDIYDRPPFVRVENSFEPAIRRCTIIISASSSPHVSVTRGGGRRRSASTTAGGSTSAILGASGGTYSGTNAKVVLEPGWGGTVRLPGWRNEMEWGKWLVRDPLETNLTRQFRASDGEWYQWSYHNDPPSPSIGASFSAFQRPNSPWRESTRGITSSHEWSCIHIQSSQPVAHYDLKTETEPKYSGGSGNVLTVYERWRHIVADIVAAMIIVRHIHATGGR